MFTDKEVMELWQSSIEAHDLLVDGNSEKAQEVLKAVILRISRRMLELPDEPKPVDPPNQAR